MSEQVFSKLRQLSLSGLSEALRNQQQQEGAYQDLPFVERLDLLLSSELDVRRQRRHKRLLSQARLRIQATLPQIDYDSRRNLNKTQLLTLAQCDWLRQAHNLIITGPCGSGKTHLACALGHQACLLGFRVRYMRLSKLLLELHHSRTDGSYLRQLQHYSRFELLILDDWGLQSLKVPERHDLIELFDERYQLHSNLIVSQRPTGQWHDTIGDTTLADAILDRLVHNAHRIELKGESMRRRLSSVAEATA